MTDRLGVYIHIPFCISRCRYCDFTSTTRDCYDLERYVTRLCEEIAESPYAKRECDSIFFGGGTPSLLSKGQIERILGALAERFTVTPDCEITVEVNPKTQDGAWFSAVRECGVNRISIGLQSANERELSALGRIHSYEDFVRCVSDAKGAGFTNISADIMLGIPYQTASSLEKTLSLLMSLGLTHISAYTLMLEEGTELFKMQHSLPFPDEESERQMYFLTHRMLTESGYSHYEISNFAKDGYQSRHNMRYWMLSDYIGFGISAHSLIGERRFFNTDDFDAYINLPFSQTVYEEAAGGDASEYIMLSLRTSNGADLGYLKERYGIDIVRLRADEIRMLTDNNLARLTDGHLILTAEGFYMSNTAIAMLLP